MNRAGLILVLLVAAPVLPADLRTLQGTTISGELVRIDGKEIVLKKGTETVATPLAQVLQLDLQAGKAAPESWSHVELTDGSVLRCSNWKLTGKNMTLTLATGQQLQLPVAALSNLYRDAQNEKHRKEWNDRLADRRAKMKRRDVLAVRKDGVLNALEGTLGDADETGETIDFTVGSGKKRAVPLAGVAGLVFERTVQADAAPVICKVLDAGGSTLQAASIVTSETGMVVTTPAGATLEYSLAQLVRLDFSGGKLTWLSDLEPIAVVETFLDANPYHYKRDHNLEDGPIRINGVTYARGLSLHATTELEYELKGEYREFKAIAGINDLVGGLPGQVALRFFGDGKLLKDILLDRRDRVHHQEVKLNIKDVQKFRIQVAPAGTGLKLDLGLHLDLADAKVSK